jgi:hypothetical protein
MHTKLHFVRNIVSSGCQKEIAAKICEKEADYVLMLKENHPTMYQEAVEYFKWIDTYARKNELCREWESGSEKDHGRIETRKITVVDADWYAEKALWKNLKTIIRCHSTRETKVKNDETGETEWKKVEFDRYYISSRARNVSDISFASIGQLKTNCIGVLM